ncbi:MAG: HD domain-containing protein [Nanoarchaeota archaeon]|mgnify:CR=1 FL=1
MENKNIIEEIRKFVEAETKKSTAKYDFEIYKFHFVPMRNYAIALAEKLNADIEIVELAAWLHDIGSIIYGRENHHITGSEIAVKKLKEFNYSAEKIEKVKNCIINHRGSVNNPRITLEEKIISDADALSNFDNLAGVFAGVLLYEKLNQKEAMISVREKLQRKYEQLCLEESKIIIKPKYEAAMILLN